MSRPAVELADILRAQGDRFLDRYQRSFDFQQLKAFRGEEGELDNQRGRSQGKASAK